LPKLSNISGSLYSTIYHKIGLPPCELHSMIGYLLHIHTEYYDMIQSNDRFDSILQIDLLKLTDVENRENDIEEKKTEESERKDSSSQNASGSGGVDDSVADTLVEILGVSREEAVNLLIQFDNNLDNIFASLS